MKGLRMPVGMTEASGSKRRKRLPAAAMALIQHCFYSPITRATFRHVASLKLLTDFLIPPIYIEQHLQPIANQNEPPHRDRLHHRCHKLHSKSHPAGADAPASHPLLHGCWRPDVLIAHAWYPR
ncbi:hypothetical protein GDO78_015358 [Eleutherodactylus coqui]|uniref:Uncharacterized protein n=1 Tax=Eleutherodactylus coqui TaxID=57060 RepID=A0A8J6JP79_ELECQ|nr:hypothetical protein GDO78_015358 [Eleutherodactylus coqui]